MSADGSGEAHAAKEAERARQRREERKETLVALAIVLVVFCAAGWWVYHAFMNPAAQAQGEAVKVPLDDSPSIGSENASVTVVEFSDFECPFCGEFARSAMPDIERAYIETGKVRLVYKHFPLSRIHPHALLAAQAAACADLSGRFWEYHDALYANQQALAEDDLVGYAQRQGINESSFRECLDKGEQIHIVTRDMDEGSKAGVSGTPTFFFNGRRVVGALTPAQFAAQVDQALAAS